MPSLNFIADRKTAIAGSLLVAAGALGVIFTGRGGERSASDPVSAPAREAHPSFGMDLVQATLPELPPGSQRIGVDAQNPPAQRVDSPSAPLLPATPLELMDLARKDTAFLDGEDTRLLSNLEIEAVRRALAEFPADKDRPWCELALKFHLDRSNLALMSDADRAKLEGHRVYPKDSRAADLYERNALEKKGYNVWLSPEERQEFDYLEHRRNVEIRAKTKGQ